MILNLYSIADKKGNFNPPFTSSNDDQATRSFGRAVNDVNSLMFLYPEDFTLYKIGGFDCDSAFIDSLSKPVFICNAVDVKKGV